MSYKDTLQLYDELMAGGCTEAQARVQAQQLGAMGDHMGDTVLGVHSKLDSAVLGMHSKLDKIDKDLIWMRVIGATLAAAFISTFIAAGAAFVSMWFK